MVYNRLVNVVSVVKRLLTLSLAFSLLLVACSRDPGTPEIVPSLVPLATVDKALNLVPIVGKAASAVTKIRIDVEGPLKDPKIQAVPLKGVATGVVGGVEESAENILKGVGKGVKSLFGDK